MSNVAVMVEDRGDTDNIFGLYQGVPLTKREYYAGAFPDLITIYQDPISVADAKPRDRSWSRCDGP